MVLKIERIAQGRATVLRLSGRIQSEHLDQLKGQIEIIKEHVILDLEEVNLVDSDVVWFLAICEDKGVKLGLCPLYIRGSTGKRLERLIIQRKSTLDNGESVGLEQSQVVDKSHQFCTLSSCPRVVVVHRLINSLSTLI